MAAAGNSIGLYRNAITTGAIPYPFNIGSLVSITGNDVDSLHYYYFYNWKVAQQACTSPAVPIKLEHCEGIQQAAGINNQVMVYPNPTTGNLTIHSSTSLGEVKVYNSLGEVVYQQRANETDMQIDLNQQAAGIYIVQTKNGLTKVIKQ